MTESFEDRKNNFAEILTTSFLPSTKQFEEQILCILIHCDNKWLLRPKNFLQCFNNEYATIYSIIDQCTESVSWTEVKYLLQERIEDNDEYKNYLSILKDIWKREPDEDSYDFLVEKLQKEKRKKDLVMVLLSKLPEIKENEPDDVIREIINKIYQITESKVERSNYLEEESVELRIKQTDALQYLKMFPTGIKELDDDLGGGFVYTDLITFVGPTGSGKSFWLSNLVYQCAAAGGHVIYFQSEMTLQLSDMRLDSRIADIDFREMKRGNLDEKKVEQWRNNIGDLRSKGGSITSFCLDGSSFTTKNVYYYSELLKSEGIVVDLIAIDYLLLMTVPEESKRQIKVHEKLGVITIELKHLANHFDRQNGTKGVLVATATQAKQDYSKIKEDFIIEDAVGYSASISHNSSVVYAALPQDEFDKATGKLTVMCLKDRTGPNKKKYAVATRFERSIFHDPSKVIAGRSDNYTSYSKSE